MGRGRARFEKQQRQKKRDVEDEVPETPKTMITIKPVEGPEIQLAVRDYTLDIERDYIDATTFGSVNQTYLASTRNYIIKASG